MSEATETIVVVSTLVGFAVANIFAIYWYERSRKDKETN